MSRPFGSKNKKQMVNATSVRRAALGKEDKARGSQGLSNAEIRSLPRFKAYERTLRLAAELDRELALAVAASPQRPEVIRECREQLMEALKVLIPYEKPRLSAVKVSGDKRAPLFDFSQLSEKELLLVRRLILKSPQVQPTEEDDED